MHRRSSNFLLAGAADSGSDAVAQSMRFVLDAEVSPSCRFFPSPAERLRDRANR
jgi:hypothetical protein